MRFEKLVDFSVFFIFVSFIICGPALTGPCSSCVSQNLMVGRTRNAKKKKKKSGEGGNMDHQRKYEYVLITAA